MNLNELKTRLAKMGNPDSGILREANNHFTNLLGLRRMVSLFDGMPGTEDLMGRIKGNKYFSTPSGDMAPVNEVSRQLHKDALSLRDFLSPLAKLLAHNTGEAKEATSDVSVYFPKAEDLPALTDQLNVLRRILEQTILDPRIGGKMEVKDASTGSFFLQICVGSAAAVGVVGSLVWAAAVVSKKVQEVRIVRTHVEALEIRNDALQVIQEGQAKMMELLVAAEARHIEREIYGGEEDPERLERFKHSIEQMQSLLERGAEVHPALLAPEEVRNLFPDFTKLALVESKIKQIANKSAD